jgi:D-alanyl-lipoteichoic acid acyltransferase DltB (MBOAT superfamily)
MAVIADYVFGQQTGGLAVGTAWIGIFAYTAQIYFDFSGYSDMAIGLGKMFGFEFLENFDYPYISCSITEFWRRWHISLGSWFRDYIYFPMGGSRVDTKFKLLRNLFVVWFLTGLWHGASWNFALWGLYYFLFIAIEKLSGLGKMNRYSFIRNIITMFVVMMGWVLFRSSDAGYAVSYIKILFGAGAGALADNDTVYYFYNNLQYFLLAIVASLPILPKLKDVYQRQKSKWIRFVFGLGQMSAVLTMFLLSVINLVNESYNPFIYFRF